jgi:hypothetical protein
MAFAPPNAASLSTRIAKEKQEKPEVGNIWLRKQNYFWLTDCIKRILRPSDYRERSGRSGPISPVFLLAVSALDGEFDGALNRHLPIRIPSRSGRTAAQQLANQCANHQQQRP